MKRKLISFMALLLAVLLLCGSSAPKPEDGKWLNRREEEKDVGGADEMCRFDEIRYERPDVDAFQDRADRLIRDLEKGAGFRKIVEELDGLLALYSGANTMYTVADIRNCQDLSDRYYAQEYAACSNILSEMRQTLEEVYRACGESAHGPRLERDWFGEGFLAEYGPGTEGTLTQAYMDLVGRENELIAQYRALSADAVIEYRGRELPLADALYDARTWREQCAIYRAYYEKYNALLGELYLEMLAVRREQAKELGYESFAELMYAEEFDRDYSVADGKAFIESVKRWVLPVYERRMDDSLQAELMEDYVSERELYQALRDAAHGMGGEAAEAYDFMRRYELCDLAMSDTKADMSFQTYLDDYDAPFLFANPYGDMGDYITVTHEFGHYVEAYISYGAYRSMDLAEVFSQGMQLLSLGHLRRTLGNRDLEKLRVLNLFDMLDSFITQAAYAEFEEQAYALEEASVEQLNAIYSRIMEEYGFGDQVELYGGLDWIDVPHFFEQPFYIISYPVSTCCALELYERELKESGAGLALFLRLVDAEEVGVVGAAAEAGLANPITDTRVKEAAAFLDAQFAA